MQREPGRVHRAAYGGLVGAVAIAGVVVAVNGWPFASYPTFAGRYGPQTSTVEVVARLADGRELPIELFRGAPTSRRTAMIWNVLSRPRTLPLALEGSALPDGTSTVVVYRVVIDTHTQRPVGRIVLLERTTS